MQLDQLFRPEVGVPDAPKWLLSDSRKAWRRLSAELTHYNLLSKIDRDAFAMLCQTIGRMEQIERGIQAKQASLAAAGHDVTDAYFDVTPNGLRIQSALYQVLNKEQAKLHRMLESFGLRPDARAKVTTAIRAQLQLFEVPKQTGQADTPKPPTDPMSFSDF